MNRATVPIDGIGTFLYRAESLRAVPHTDGSTTYELVEQWHSEPRVLRTLTPKEYADRMLQAGWKMGPYGWEAV